MSDCRELTRRALTAGFLALAIAGCAPAVSVAPDPLVPREPLSETGVEIAAVLIELQDRREYDVDVLDAAASSAESAIRRLAALVAARLGEPESRRLVRHLLGDQDTSVAATAAFAVGVLRDTTAVPLLADLLEPGALVAPSVAAEAADALGKIASNDATSALARFLTSADTAAATLHRVIESALIGAWRGGESSLGTYLRWLSAGNPELRWRAAYGLTRRRTPGAVRPLLGVLSDPHSEVRAVALRGVHAPVVADAGVSPTDILPLVLPLLEDSSYAVRIEAIRAVASFGAGAGLDRVLQIAAAGAPHERAAAIEAIGRLGPAAASAGAFLRQLAEDPGTHVHLRELAVGAATAVEPSGARGWLVSLSLYPAWRLRAAVARAVASLEDAGPRDIEPFVRDADPRIAAAALTEIVSWESADRLRPFRPLLLEALESGDVYVRAAALEAFLELADPTVFPTFLDVYQRALSDPQNDAQLAAIDAIANLRDAGVPAPERVFFTRFDRPGDYLVRRRAAQRFGAAAVAAWGDESSIATGVTPRTYEAYVRRWLAPAAPDTARPRVRIEMQEGVIEVLLLSESAPLTVANFLTLTAAGFFDGQEWPRVVPNFVVQGGDPRGDTSGGPGYSIRDEINRMRYDSGRMGMALSGPDTGGSQFFIAHSPQPHLDGTYSVFGEVVSGHDLLQRILPGDRIIRVTEIVEAPL